MTSPPPRGTLPRGKETAIAPEEASELQKLLAGEATEEQCQVSLKRLSSLLFRSAGAG